MFTGNPGLRSNQALFAVICSLVYRVDEAPIDQLESIMLGAMGPEFESSKALLRQDVDACRIVVMDAVAFRVEGLDKLRIRTRKKSSESRRRNLEMARSNIASIEERRGVAVVAAMPRVTSRELREIERLVRQDNHSWVDHGVFVVQEMPEPHLNSRARTPPVEGNKEGSTSRMAARRARTETTG